MDSARNLRRWLVCLVAAGGVSLMLPAAPAAAEVGALNVTAPTAPIAFNASFSMTINYANNGAAAIEDPDIALYLMAKNTGGVAQPLLPEHVTITAPSTPVQKWNTGAGTQVGVKFWPDLHTNLAPGWNSNYTFTVGVAMPPGTATLALGVRVWKSSAPATVYATWTGQVTVNPPLPPPPPPVTSSPTPRPQPSSAAPATSSPTPAQPSPTPAASQTAAAETPAPAASIVTVAAPGSGGGIGWWVWLGLLMIAGSGGVLVWLVFRWRQGDAEPGEA
ncbi:hypothetical protein Rhe02_37310 [Rhizocola hellebori]|uniref:DUF916 domain-containing protein n=1 Tax=Rhizocola hellebori TaxID=1392758 RepID=A0A8J3VFT7_9ACTN|nr:hypothetical protein [Rhizocola hellebori]GIH05664.1 hypothetical protein Rhe02_37310 [Rhizocola hellebori]